MSNHIKNGHDEQGMKHKSLFITFYKFSITVSKLKVTQIYEILKDVMEEITGLPVSSDPGGEEDVFIIKEDLSNIVDVGTRLFDSSSGSWKDNYVKSLINRIGRMVFVDRPYSGWAPNIQRDSWEYGAIMAKIRVKTFDAKPNPSWSLQNGQTVNQFEYNAPEVSEFFYNKRVAWQIDCSFAEMQVRESFRSPSELNRFFSTIESTINKSQTMYIDALEMRAINNFIAEKINAGNGVVDLLSGYNAAFGTTLTAAAAITNVDFLRYAAYTILLYKDRLKAASEVFNMNTDTGYPTFTPASDLHLVLISNVAKALDVYLQSETFHNDFTEIGKYDTIPFWQSSGQNFATEDVTHINIGLASDSTVTVNRNYVIGLMFDRDAIAITNENRRTTSAYNANGEYYNNFYKIDTSYINDLAENGVIFTIGNGEIN